MKYFLSVLCLVLFVSPVFSQGRTRGQGRGRGYERNRPEVQRNRPNVRIREVHRYPRFGNINRRDDYGTYNYGTYDRIMGYNDGAALGRRDSMNRLPYDPVRQFRYRSFSFVYQDAFCRGYENGYKNTGLRY